MFRTSAFAAVLIALGGGSAMAADLPPNTKLGAVFAKPRIVAAPRVEVETWDYPIGVFAPQVDIPPLVNGYYGKPNSFYYRSYYENGGTAPGDTYIRQPYACSFHGYC